MHVQHLHTCNMYMYLFTYMYMYLLTRTHAHATTALKFAKTRVEPAAEALAAATSYTRDAAAAAPIDEGAPHP